MNLVKSIAEPTAAGKDVEALERLDRRQGGGRRPAQDVEDNHYYEDIHDDDDIYIMMHVCVSRKMSTSFTGLQIMK